MGEGGGGSGGAAGEWGSGGGVADETEESEGRLATAPRVGENPRRAQSPRVRFRQEGGERRGPRERFAAGGLAGVSPVLPAPAGGGPGRVPRRADAPSGGAER